MRATFKHNKSVEDTRSNNGKDPRAEDLVDILKIGKAWVRLRPVGPIAVKGVHWVPADLAKAEEAAANPKGKERPKNFPQICLAFNPETEEVDSTAECPWCKSGHDLIRLNSSYYQNFIVRELQEDEPKKKGQETKKETKTGFKEKGSTAWTPVRVLPMSNNLVNEIKAISALNRHKDKKTGEKKAFPLTHAKYGRDIMVMYDADEKVAAKRWKVQLEDKSSLSEDEQNYLLWDIESLDAPKSLKDAKEEYKRWAKRQKASTRDDDDSDDDDSDDSDDEDDEDEPKAKKKGKGKADKKAKGKKPKDDDDEDDLDDDDDLGDDDDDEDDAPKKKSKGKKSKDDDDEDDDLDDEDDLDDDDDDDEPKKKKKSKSKGKSDKKSKGKKSKDEDDDDEDDDDDLDDDDLDDDDEDDDDEPKKSQKKSGKGASKKSKRDSEDDEDDLDDDEDLDDDDSDDDDEDEPKSKKKGKGKADKKAKGKKSKGKKSKDDDDEDD